MKKTLGLATILIMLVIYACKKDITTLPIQTKVNSLSVEELKKSLARNTDGYAVNSDGNNSSVGSINWLKTYSLNLKNGSNILSVPLTRSIDDYINGIQKRLVAHKDSLGAIKKEIMVVRPDEEFLKLNNGGAPLKTFTGKILFYSTDYIFSRGYVLENGKIIGQVNVVSATTIEKEQDPQKIQGWSEECEWRKMGYVVENGGINIWYVKFCMWKYTETYLPPEETIDWIEPEPPYGAYTWEEKDSDKFDVTDSLDAYPCAKGLLTTMVDLKNQIALIVKETFVSNSDFNIRFVPYNFGSGSLLDGEFIVNSFKPKKGYNLDSGFIYNGTIRLNEDVLKHATKEYILATMYHEVLHAFIGIEKNRLTQSQFEAKYPSINLQFVYGPQGAFDFTKPIFIKAHDTMGQHFSDQLYAAVKSFNSSLSDSTAYAISQSGIYKLSNNLTLLNQNERDVRKRDYLGTKCP